MGVFMADITIMVPGKDSVTITVGETLTIDFIEDCCFCCDPTQVDSFFPQLPLGDHKAGKTWQGVAQITVTIQFHHTPYGQGCNSKHSSVMDSGRTIVVGGGG
jgi:hypothetical protein